MKNPEKQHNSNKSNIKAKKPRTNNPTWKSYNNAPLREGEVLVPHMVESREFVAAHGMIPDNLRYWSDSGIKFPVMFVPVAEEIADALWQEFNGIVNEMLNEKLGRNRHSRCLVPQPDGSRKPCPKVKKGNHPPCATCPHRGEYEREDRSILSLEELKEKNPDIAGSVPSAEDICLEMEMFQGLVEHLRSMDPLLADVVTMGINGLERKEIVKKLPVKTTQAYALYKKAEKATREYLKR